MRQTIIGTSSQTKRIEHMIELLLDKGYEIQDISLIMLESRDIPQSYLQQLELIDQVIGTRFKIDAIPLPSGESVAIGGPISALLQVEPNVTDIGSLAGGFLNALMDIGFHEPEAKQLVKELHENHIILGISLDDTKIDEMIDLFSKQGLEHVAVIPE